MEKQQQQQKTEHHKTTGASNVEFDLYSEMHSLLKGNSALEQYIEDARAAADHEVESCFKMIRDQNKDHVTKLRALIGKHLKPS